ncbi:MAG: 16S rRNA (adenine(1518)-N(6)/adenine(1519)-N(6))-dimethyltransferase RsmA [Clostridia bacterium]
MSKTKDRMRESNLRYRQSLGQNFIYDEELLAALTEAAEVSGDEDVLEIGPGCGSLTKHLCRAARKVLSIELDERLIPLLQAFLAEEKNWSVVQGDIMTVNLPEITAALQPPFAVVANIPYYITTPLIQRLLTAELPISRMALMVQKEVADKILAAPGEDGWGPLAVRCQYMCEPRRLMEVPASCFTPPPKVDSTFILLPMRKEPAVQVESEEMFFRVVNAAFALRRKTLLNGLCAAFRVERAEAAGWLEAAGIDPMVRGEKLGLAEFGRLADAVRV